MFIHIIIMFKFIVSKELQNHSNPAILSFPVENRDGMRVEKVIPWYWGKHFYSPSTRSSEQILWFARFSTTWPHLAHLILFPTPVCNNQWFSILSTYHVLSLTESCFMSLPSRVMPFLPILSTFWNNTHSQGLPQFTKSWLLLAFFSSCVRKASLLFRHAIRCVWVEAVF